MADQLRLLLFVVWVVVIASFSGRLQKMLTQCCNVSRRAVLARRCFVDVLKGVLDEVEDLNAKLHPPLPILLPVVRLAFEKEPDA